MSPILFVVTISYIYDLPFFSHANGLSHTLLGDWQFSGIAAFQTGLPFGVKYSKFDKKAGVASFLPSVNYSVGGGVAVFADVVGDGHAKPTAACAAANGGAGPLLFNPCAFAFPTGLTFGDSGRNFLHMPSRTNFDMSLLKHFKIKESTASSFARKPSTSSTTRSGTEAASETSA